jgi:hypothetical protein
MPPTNTFKQGYLINERSGKVSLRRVRLGLVLFSNIFLRIVDLHFRIGQIHFVQDIVQSTTIFKHSKS